MKRNHWVEAFGVAIGMILGFFVERQFADSILHGLKDAEVGRYVKALFVTGILVGPFFSLKRSWLAIIALFSGQCFSFVMEGGGGIALVATAALCQVPTIFGVAIGSRLYELFHKFLIRK